MSASGEVSQDSGQPIHPGAALTGSQLLELGVKAKVHIKHVESGREWTVEGPARLIPCAGGEEEIFLGQGTLRTELGAGVRPGAQVLIGTPFGSVGYADARAELIVTERELRLVASAGEAWLTPADPAAAPVRVSGASPMRRSERARLAAVPALASCAKAAAESENQAKALLLPSEQALGERASAHVRERQRARTLCAGAAAAVLQQTRGAELAARLRELDAHRASWRRVPSSEG
jgi:hypothetical protein